MGNFDEIEVAAIAIDKTTILEIKATIAMPFWLSSVANVSRGITKKKYACPKECCTLHQSLFFFSANSTRSYLFSRCCRCCDCSNLLVALPRKAIISVDDFISGLKITAGQWIMSGQDDVQTFGLLVILTGHLYCKWIGMYVSIPFIQEKLSIFCLLSYYIKASGLNNYCIIFLFFWQDRSKERDLTELKFLRSVSMAGNSQKIILSPDWRYRKIPKISLGAYVFQRPFLKGLYSEGLIYGGKFAFQNRFG